jgi:putative ABC transport system permease protein
MLNTVRRSVRNLRRTPGRSLLAIALIAVTLSAALIALTIRAGAQAAVDDIVARVGNRVELTSSLAGQRRRLQAEAERIRAAGGDLSQLVLTLQPPDLDEVLADRLSASPLVVKYDKSLRLQVSSPDLEPLPEQLGEGRFLIGGREFAQRRGAALVPLLGEQAAPLTVLAHLDSSLAMEFLSGQRELREGRHVTAQDTENGTRLALIDEALAALNQFALGDSFTLEVRVADDAGEVVTVPVTVEIAGIFSTTRGEAGTYFRDPGNTLLVTLSAVRDVTPQPSLRSAAYFLTRAEDYDAFRDEAAALGLDLEQFDLVSNAQELRNLAGPLHAVTSAANMGLYVSLLAGAITVILLMSIIARERKREMGILRALGGTKLQVAGGFFAEAVVLCCAALVIGILAASYLAGTVAQMVTAQAQAGLAAASPLPGGQLPGMGAFSGRSMGRGLMFLPVMAVQYQLGWQQIAAGMGITVLLAAAGALMPTILCLRLRPSDILRSE